MGRARVIVAESVLQYRGPPLAQPSSSSSCLASRPAGSLLEGSGLGADVLALAREDIQLTHVHTQS